MKGYKVTDGQRSKLVGIACNSLQELRRKSYQKLGITEDSIVALEDGTVVDDEDYFKVIPNQSVLVFYRKNEKIKTGVDYLLDTLRTVNASYLKAGGKANEFLLQRAKELVTLLEDKKDEKDRNANTRSQDPDWFEGLETNAQTKEDYMFKKSQDRIRGYFYKFQEDVKKSELYLYDSSSRKELSDCLSHFRIQLKLDNYFGCFFDRRCSSKSVDDVDSYPKRKIEEELIYVKRFKTGEDDDIDGLSKNRRSINKIEMPSYTFNSYCDETGKFTCQGKWELSGCPASDGHVINPYSSRESRILFSTWNLDHRIEKSRTVFPTLLKAVEARREDQLVNYQYFYRLLFTNVNLKLVHVVCHDKSAHNLTCDSRYLFIERQSR